MKLFIIGDVHLGHIPSWIPSEDTAQNKVLQMRREALFGAARIVKSLAEKEKDPDLMAAIPGDLFDAKTPACPDDLKACASAVETCNEAVKFTIVTIGNHDCRPAGCRAKNWWHDSTEVGPRLHRPEGGIERKKLRNASLIVADYIPWSEMKSRVAELNGSEPADIILSHMIVPEVFGVDIGKVGRTADMAALGALWILNDVHRPVNFVDPKTGMRIIYPGCVNATSSADEDAGGVAEITIDDLGKFKSVVFHDVPEKPIFAKVSVSATTSRTIYPPGITDREGTTVPVEGHDKMVFVVPSGPCRPSMVRVYNDGTESGALAADALCRTANGDMKNPWIFVHCGREAVAEEKEDGEALDVNDSGAGESFTSAIGEYAEKEKLPQGAVDLAIAVLEGGNPAKIMEEKDASQQCNA